MSDAINFPLSDSNQDSNLPADMLGASCPQEPGESAGEPTSDAAHSNECPAASCLSDAAAEAARSLGSDSLPRTRNETPASPVERRRRRRALISTPVRVRRVDITDNGPDEISTTVDVSRNGLLFITANPYFLRDMDVAVTFPYCKTPGVRQAEQDGRVMRVHELPDGRYSVAIAIGAGAGEDLVDACGRKLDNEPVRLAYTPDPASKKLLILAVDADDLARETMKSYLSNEGYEVVAVSKGSQAREFLEKHVPALLIAEVEGEGLPGFDLCAHVKSTQRLKHIPVLLTTRSGNPSDYSNAHSLGAVVCMAKPYKQDRLGHVVRLLAPPPPLCPQTIPPARSADSGRRAGNGNGTAAKSPAAANNPARRFRFPSFRS